MPRNGLGRARRVEVIQDSDAGPDVPTRILEIATAILAPPRRAAALALGSSTLLVRAISGVLSEAAAEGERQLARAGTTLLGLATLWRD